MKWFLVVAALLLPAVGNGAEVGGTWQGSYICNQGLTGLTLTVVPSPHGAAKGVFRFYQVDANPGVPDGCFAMSGNVFGDELRLQAGKWLFRPFGYVTVDLAGSVSPDGSELTGAIFGPKCTSFSLRRITDYADPAPCRIVNVPVS